MKAWFSLWLALLVTILVSGCAGFLGPPQLGRYTYTKNALHQSAQPVRTIPIWIDKNFGEADKLAIDDAIKAWNYTMNGYIVLKPVDWQFDMEIPKIVTQVAQGGWLFMKIDHTNSMIPDTTKGFWTIGFTEQVGGHHLFLVRDRLGNDDVFGVTMHEIGHLMGSGHVGERLMYPHYTRAGFQCVDWETINVVGKYWGIDVANLNFCVDKEPGDIADKPLKTPESGPVL